MRLELNVMSDLAARESPGFWSNRDRIHVVVTLQDRVGQVETFVESCHSTLDLVYSAMFPLNHVP